LCGIAFTVYSVEWGRLAVRSVARLVTYLVMKGMLIMRIDKYLKITRIIKRRTVANEACDAGKIEVNGKVVRASYDVKVGDVIAVNMGQRPLKVEVLNVTEYATKENAAENYRVIE
jgi:ribosomal 50S subunit-recycling heat shock protein